MTGKDLLEVEDLRVSFGRVDRSIMVVRGISFAVRRGETVALVGESGSGKSVTSLAVLGLVGKGRPHEHVSGSVRFHREDGTMEELTRLDRAAMRRIQGEEIAMVFQEPMTALNPVLRIGEQIAEMLVEHRGMSKHNAWEAAEKLLDRVGIPDSGRRLKSYPHQLSGGMRQRVMIAMALSCAPALLIADEPTTALDVTIQAQILDLIAELKMASGSAVLFITHDLAVVSQIADRVVVLYAGCVVEQGRTARVLETPLHPYTRGLLECVPRLSGEGDSPRSVKPIPGLVPDPARPPAGCAFHPRCRFAQPGRCDVAVPALEVLPEERQVRCVRWREIVAGAVV
jgi:oligopeptide transport system ATP-binding protein